MMEEIKSMILGLCRDKEWGWRAHIESVVKYSRILAGKTDADEEVCELSAWLHDIIKIRDGKKDLHHVNGSEEAVRILEEYGYPKDRIQQVKHCILTHSSDENYTPESVEAKIVASADALSHFDNLLELAHYAFVIKKESVDQCRETLLRKYEKSWNKLLIPEAREIARPKYEAIKLVLGEQD
ncbi:MAG: HD domain-containing protein [Candidatus Woesearchaeota archaeon]